MIKMVGTYGDIKKIDMTSIDFDSRDVFTLYNSESEDFKNAYDLVRGYIQSCDLDKSGCKFRCIPHDNAFMFTKDTKIAYEDDTFTYGFFVQFNLAREEDLEKQVANVMFMTGAKKAFDKCRTVFSWNFHLSHCNEANFKVLEKDDQIDKGFVDLCRTVCRELDIYEKDTASCINNMYLLFDAIKPKQGIVFETYQKLKKEPFIKNCRYEGKSIFVKLDSDKGNGKIETKNYRINITSGDSYEVNTALIKDYETLRGALEQVCRGGIILGRNYMGLNMKLIKYSNTKDFMDLVDERAFHNPNREQAEKQGMERDNVGRE